MLLPLLATLTMPQTAPPTASPTLPSNAPRFEAEIRAFEEADRADPPKPGAVVFVGSSSIRLWSTLAADLPEYRVLNRGFGGSWMQDSARMADRIVVPYHPSAVVIFAGTNDLADGRTPEQVAGDFGAFVGRVRAALPEVPIAYLPISPAPSRAALLPKMKLANALIRAQCARGPRLRYIDTYPQMLNRDGSLRPEIFGGDQLHMNARGYAIWTPLVRGALARMLPKGSPAIRSGRSLKD